MGQWLDKIVLSKCGILGIIWWRIKGWISSLWYCLLLNCFKIWKISPGEVGHKKQELWNLGKRKSSKCVFGRLD